MLEYYHKKHLESNSTITIYGENHLTNYNEFLSKFIKSIYESTDRRKIIIVEKNELELNKKNSAFNLFTIEHENQETNIFHKLLAIKMTPQPIFYFSEFYNHEGVFPNTQIILGDNRQRNMMNLAEELESMFTADPNAIIDSNFLEKLKTGWNVQLSVLTFDEFNDIKNEINDLLMLLLPTMKNEEINSINRLLNKCWIEISNISMLSYIMNYINEGVDIIFFVGALHMRDLIERIERRYQFFHDDTDDFDTDDDDFDTDDFDTDTDDDFDTDEEHCNYWFRNRLRLNGNQIELNKIYDIRSKKSDGRFGHFKLISVEGNKIMLENCFPYDCNIRNIELNVNKIYAYEKF